MSGQINRVQFLRGDVTGRHAPIRPPWALDEAAFIETCSRCDDCIKVCETGIISRGRGGFPEVDFKRGECSFCGACVSACGEAALLRGEGAAAWSLQAVIESTCLEYRGVACRVCGEHCDARAIQFRQLVGGRSEPRIDTARCNACGACYGVCPEGAISLRAPVQPLGAITQ